MLGPSGVLLTVLMAKAGQSVHVAVCLAFLVDDSKVTGLEFHDPTVESSIMSREIGRFQQPSEGRVVSDEGEVGTMEVRPKLGDCKEYCEAFLLGGAVILLRLTEGAACVVNYSFLVLGIFLGEDCSKSYA